MVRKVKDTAQGLSLQAVWNTACIRWVVDRVPTVQPLQRAEVEEFQRAFGGAADERYAEFLGLAARRLAWSADEDAAMRILAAAARPKLQEIVELPEVDFRFTAGLFLHV